MVDEESSKHAAEEGGKAVHRRGPVVELVSTQAIQMVRERNPVYEARRDGIGRSSRPRWRHISCGGIVSLAAVAYSAEVFNHDTLGALYGCYLLCLEPSRLISPVFCGTPIGHRSPSVYSFSSPPPAHVF